MRVLMLETGGWGGICHYSYNLCQALAQAGANTKLLTATPYELSDIPHDFDVTTGFEAETSYREKIGKVIACSRHFKPDVIHVQSTFSARKDWLGLLACRILKVPTVLTTHNVLPHDEAEKNAKGMQWAYRKIYHYAQHIIVHSQDSQNALASLFAPPPEKVTIIPHGNYVFTESDTPFSQEESRDHLKLDQNKRYLLAFGTIRPYKGTDDLLTAFAQIASKFPDVHLLIAGKPIGLDPQTIITQAQALGIDQQMVFRPDYIDLNDIAHYFMASDIAVYPYHAIYQSGALQLAYAFSKPVVATSVGAFPETIDNGKNGLLAPPKQPEKFAQALVEMLNYPPDKLATLGAHSRHLADTRYAWSSVAEKTVAIYNQLSKN